MARIVWDGVGERIYETGVDHGVLYLPNQSGVYDTGVAWNGLISVNEAPSGAEATPQYADNIKYLNLVSAEEFGGTIEAFTYPVEFARCDGSAELTPGVFVGQQTRSPFGLSYRTLIGNDTNQTDHGYKLHLVYNALASPSEKAYNTVNESPEAITFSWEFSTTGVPVPGHKPSATITIDSTKVDAEALATLEDILYGTALQAPRLPLPAEIYSIFENTVTTVVATPPTFDTVTNTITIPTVTGVVYLIDNAPVTGTVVIDEDTIVYARAEEGYLLSPSSDDDWYFAYTA